MRVLEHEFKCPVCGEVHECVAKEVDSKPEGMTFYAASRLQDVEGLWWFDDWMSEYNVTTQELLKVIDGLPFPELVIENVTSLGWRDTEDDDRRLFVQYVDGEEWVSDFTFSQIA